MGKKCQYLAQIGQKCQFWAKFGRFWAKILILNGLDPHNVKPTQALCSHFIWSGMAPDGPKMPIFGQNDQICIFWANFSRFWVKILILTGESKCFCIHVTEKLPTHLVGIVYGWAWDQMGQKMPIFGQKSQFWAKFGRFWAKNLNLTGVS